MKKPKTKKFKDIIKIYGLNLSKIDMTGVIFSDCDLREVKFKKDSNLFQKIENKNLCGVVMPCKDFSRYNFKGVLLKNTVFPKGAILPKYKDFFQEIKNKDISNSILPVLNYSKYNFRRVLIKGTVFPEGCILPEDYSFFQKINHRDFTGTILPRNVVENLHLYDLEGTKFDIGNYNLNENQLLIIYKKISLS